MFTLWSGKTSRLCDGVSRRDFLRVGSLGIGGLTLADLLRHRARARESANAPPPKAVIMLFLGGGPSHIDTYDLKPDAPAEIRGPFNPIPTRVAGFQICELMPKQAAIADKLAVVRNLQMSTSFHQDQEVFSGYFYGGGPLGPSLGTKPAFGSVVSRVRGGRGNVPAYVSLLCDKEGRLNAPSETPAYLGYSHRPFAAAGTGLDNLRLVPGVTRDRLGDRRALLHTFDTLRRDLETKGEMEGKDQFTSRALQIITSDKARDAFDINKEPARVRETYGRHNMQYLQARRLVEAGVGVVTITPSFGHWDDHGDIFNRLKQRLPVMDQGLHALITDLHERGLEKDVVVLAWGEFGRTPKISINKEGMVKGTPGRDHYGPANFAFLAGGGLQMGQVIGETDKWGARPTGGLYRPQNVLATVYHVLGIDPATQVHDHQGRPVYLLDEREPIQELV